MELRDQDKNMGMPLPSSFSYNNQLNNRDSSTKVHPSPSPQPINSTVNSQILNPRPPQTLDHYPLSHHHELNQLHQANIDPVVGATVSTTATANRSSSGLKSPATANRSSSGLKSPATTNRSSSGLKSPATSQPEPVSSTPLIRYRECLKNHAASMGAHVVDGCGEFMPSGEDGTMEALKCAACECHRNFHRKEINGESKYAPQPSSYHRHHHHHHHTSKNGVVHLQQPAPLNQQRFPLGLSVSTPSTAIPIAPVMMNFGGGGGAAESSSEDLNMFQSNPGGQSSQSSRKRFRTKFSQDQKDKMMEFSEKLGWRIQKQDEQELQQFCARVGVKRQVFKVWMHNNKQAMKKKQM